MRAHCDEICSQRPGRAQNPIEGGAGNDDRAASQPAKLGHRLDLLGQNPLGFTLLDLDQLLWLLVVDDMDESELGIAAARKQTCPPYGPVGSCREVRRREDLHVRTPHRNRPSSGVRQAARVARDPDRFTEKLPRSHHQAGFA